MSHPAAGDCHQTPHPPAGLGGINIPSCQGRKRNRREEGSKATWLLSGRGGRREGSTQHGWKGSARSWLSRMLLRLHPRFPSTHAWDRAWESQDAPRMIPVSQEEAQKGERLHKPHPPGLPGLLEQLQAAAGRHRAIPQLLTRVRSSPTPGTALVLDAGSVWAGAAEAPRGMLSAALGTQVLLWAGCGAAGLGKAWSRHRVWEAGMLRRAALLKDTAESRAGAATRL